MGRARGRSARRRIQQVVQGEVVKAVGQVLELSRSGPGHGTPRGAVSVVDAVQAMTTGATTITDGVIEPARNMARSPLDDLPFGPLAALLVQPLNPPRKDTGQPEPRVWEYPTGFNLPGGGDRLIDWQVLRRASVDVDVIRRCIEIRKEDVEQLRWSWKISEDAIAAEQRKNPGEAKEDIEERLRDKFTGEIDRLTKLWRNPWRTNGVRFRQWIKMVMEDHIVLDAVSIYPLTNLAGDVIGFRLVDGSTIKPLINADGERPQPPFPAFQQNLQGFPRGEYWADTVVDPNTGEDVVAPGLTAYQLTYWVENRRTNSPYGLSQVEQALIAASLYLKRQGWQHAEYDEGSTPDTWLVPPAEQFNKGYSPTQRREYEQALNNDLSGQTGKRQQVKLSYPGYQPVQMQQADEKYRPDLDLHLVKMTITHLGVTPDRYGIVEDKGLGATGQHEAQADVQEDTGAGQDATMLADLINDLSTNYLSAPPELVFAFESAKTRDSADEDAVADAQIKRGSMTLNEDRRRLGRPAFTFPEADMSAFYGATGPMYLEGGLEHQQAMNGLAENPPAPGALGGPGGTPRPGGRSGGAGGAGGSKPKPSGPRPPGRPARNKSAVDAEVIAFGRWLRKQVGGDKFPARPFRFEHAEPSDLLHAGHHPSGKLMAFAGWEWREDITKDWRSWNASHPLHPRGPHGRFVKVGDLVGELERHHGELSEMHENAFDEAVRRAHAGRHIKRGESMLADDLERRGLLEEYGGPGGNRGKLEVSEAGRRHMDRRLARADEAAAAPVPPEHTPAGVPEPLMTGHEAAMRSITHPSAPESDDEYVPVPGEVAMRERQARIDVLRRTADVAAEMDELREAEFGVEESRRRVLAFSARHPNDTALADLATQVAAADSLDEMHRIAATAAADAGLSPIGRAGDVARFDPRVHKPIGPGIPPGTPVGVIKPGYAWEGDPDGLKPELSRPIVEEITEAEYAADLAKVDPEAIRAIETPRERLARVERGDFTPHERAEHERISTEAQAMLDRKAAREAARAERLAAIGRKSRGQTDATAEVPAAPVDSPGHSPEISGTVRPMEPEDKSLIGNQYGEWERPMSIEDEMAGPPAEVRQFLPSIAPAGKETPKPIKLSKPQAAMLTAMRNGTMVTHTHGTFDALRSRGLIEQVRDEDGKIGPPRLTAGGHRALDAHNGVGATSPDTSMPQGTGVGAGTPGVALTPTRERTLAAIHERAQAGQHAVNAAGQKGIHSRAIDDLIAQSLVRFVPGQDEGLQPWERKIELTDAGIAALPRSTTDAETAEQAAKRAEREWRAAAQQHGIASPESFEARSRMMEAEAALREETYGPPTGAPDTPLTSREQNALGRRAGSRSRPGDAARYNERNPVSAGTGGDRPGLAKPRTRRPEIAVGTRVESDLGDGPVRGTVVSRTGSSMKVRWDGVDRPENLAFGKGDQGVRVVDRAEQGGTPGLAKPRQNPELTPQELTERRERLAAQREADLSRNGTTAMQREIAGQGGDRAPNTEFERDTSPTGQHPATPEGVRAAYAELAAGPGEWVNLDRLRERFPDVPRADLDKVLRDLEDSPDVMLEADANQKLLTSKVRAAAVRVGGEDRHILSIGLRDRENQRAGAGGQHPTTPDGVDQVEIAPRAQLEHSIRERRKAQAQQRELQDAIDADKRAHMDADIAEYDRLYAEAEGLDTSINFAESDDERAQLQAQRDRLDNQMSAVDRRIAQARKELARERRNKAAGSGDEGKA